MPKNPNGGPAGPLDSPGSPEADSSMASSERRGPARAGSEPRPALEARGGAAPAAPADESATSQARGGRSIFERKKQFLIAARHPGDGVSMLGFAPLQLASVEQALRANPDIEIVDTVGPRQAVGALASGMGGAMGGGQGVLVARMSEQKAAALHQQGQGRLLVERDQHLALLDRPRLQPSFVTSAIPSSGPAFTAVFSIVNKDGVPLADAEVSLFGSMLPATAITDGSGQVTLSLFGETATSIRGLYVKPKADYWSFYHPDPDIDTEQPNVVALRALADWPQLAGMARQSTFGWGQKAMRADHLPPHFRGQGIKVAVIDSGAATSHDSLNRIRAGFDIVNKKTNPNSWNEDALGHGSHCTGVIAGAELAAGVRGFAPDAEIHVCKLFPGGQVSQLIDALEYCIEKQIDVVNLSLGGAEPSEALEQQIIRARRAGVACIVAAGNSGNAVQYPASSPNVLAVAAIGKLDEFPPDSYHAQTLSGDVDAQGYFSASFSCFGPQVAVCGPGVAITSTVPPNNYAAWDGTSMAAPHITGLAALMLAHHPDFQTALKQRGPERVERLFQLIKASARRVSLGDQTRIGLGLPDAVAALGLQAGPQMAAQQRLPHQQAYQQTGFHPQGMLGAAMDPGMPLYAPYLPGGFMPQSFGPGLPFGLGGGYGLGIW